uniref:Uncharacterized protein n=1 Tax=Rhizophora mucronata TaxID=61149 RepID=A0A2P2QP38_RHIMU
MHLHMFKNLAGRLKCRVLNSTSKDYPCSKHSDS